MPKTMPRRKACSITGDGIDWRPVKTIVVAGSQGRLGNQLVLFANVIAFSLRHDLRVINFDFLPYAEYFVGTSGERLYCEYPPAEGQHDASLSFMGRSVRSSAWVAARLADRFRFLLGDRVVNLGNDASGLPENLARLEKEVISRRLLVMRGFSFRDVESVETYGDRIRGHFRLAEPFAGAVAASARERRRDSALIGVHVRKGDYARYKDGRYGYSAETYATLIRRARRLFPADREVSFVLVSDDVLTVEQIERECPEVELGRGPGHFVEDQYLLAECDYILGPPSTFSKWASFYGRKPLYQVLDPNADFSLDDFRIYSGLEPYLGPPTT